MVDSAHPLLPQEAHRLEKLATAYDLWDSMPTQLPHKKTLAELAGSTAAWAFSPLAIQTPEYGAPCTLPTAPSTFDAQDLLA